MTTRTLLLLLGAGLSAALLLAGCSPASAPEPTSTTASTVEDSGSSARMHIHDSWVKATDSDMTAVFGELHNESDHDVTVESVSVSIPAMVQQHETVIQSDGSSTMQELAGGIVIPAGQSVSLAPGGTHIMLMDLTAPILPGDEITVDLALSDGSTFTFTAVAKEYTGAQETYAPEGTDGGHQH